MTADTSAVVAALADWHEQHEQTAAALATVESLPAHVLTEAYSVMTRLPAGRALTADDAVTLLAGRFPGPALRTSDEDRSKSLRRLAAAGVWGGSTYDGLVALEAAAHNEVLLTRDRRAETTYRRLGVRFELIA